MGAARRMSSLGGLVDHCLGTVQSVPKQPLTLLLDDVAVPFKLPNFVCMVRPGGESFGAPPGRSLHEELGLFFLAEARDVFSQGGPGVFRP